MSESVPLRDPQSEEWVGVRMTNPLSGESIEVVELGRGETGSFARARLQVAPGGRGPPRHVHPNQEERFEVRTGELTVHLDGGRRVLSAGESVVVPAGTPHRFENETAEPVVFTGAIRPASRVTHVIATLFGLVHDGRVRADGSPGFLQAMVFAREMQEEIRLATPPYPVQRLLWTVLAPIGRRMGLQATYDRYLQPEFWERAAEAWESATAL